MASPCLLFVHGVVYTPNRLGKRTIIVAGSQIIGIVLPSQHAPIRDAATAAGISVDDINVDERDGFICPGFVDVHVHVTGGGGEAGPTSRCPEARLSGLVEAGVTTCVGILGTDSVSRSLSNLLVKLQALESQGLSTYMWAGAYQFPIPTLTGSIKTDLALVDKVIGVGEVAISDHRGSQPTRQDLAALVSETRVAGMLSGKAGVVHCHMGTHKSGIEPLLDLLDHTALPIANIYPTHASRTPQLRRDMLEWFKRGGVADITASARSNATVQALEEWKAAGVDLSTRVTVSSDAYGSSPAYDKKGNLIRYDSHTPVTLLRTLRLLLERGWDPQDALPLFTSTPARVLKLDKGTIAVGRCADLLVLSSSAETRYVIAKGRILKTPRFTAAGMWETLNSRKAKL